MPPLCRMDFIPLYRAIVRIDTGKLDLFAEVVSTVRAEGAFSTGNARLDGYPIPYASTQSLMI